ncbi:MAG: hypothetical protein OEL79_01615 [Chromatiales bacterium]|nr:hypothetical protein [Chromatiales bacterium]
MILEGSPVIAAEKSEEIIVWNRLIDNPVAYRVLTLALDQSVPEFGPYRLTSSTPMEQGRMVAELEHNNSIHVASFAPNAERESRLLPVRIPVTKGLLGIRVCLIRKGTQELFNGVQSLEEWRERGLTIGQGTHWPDTTILEHNGLTVRKTAKYESLFKMLISKRFHCFSRSVSEVLPELDRYAEQGIELERNLALVYRLPTFFFVSRDNPRLARRLNRGMQLAQQDGSFDRLINENYAPQFKQLGLSQRTAIPLDNPLLSNETRAIVDNKELWLDPFQE